MRPLNLILAGVLVVAAATRITAATDALPIVFESARVSIAGTSNVHDYTAATSDVRLTAIEVNGWTADGSIEQLLQPGTLTRFDVTISASTLKSAKDGLNKNMYKALKVQNHPDIRFQLRSLARVDGDAYRAVGALTIAGVEKETLLALQVVRKGSAQLAVTGRTEVLMTDFGVTPPTAMMGMVRSNPKVVITLELVLSQPVS
jgi:polyisoprenoid-binding protein YceI